MTTTAALPTLPFGVVPGSHTLIWVEGPDAVSFVDGQVSQDVAGMAAGEVRRSLLLEPRGKLRALLWVLRGDERVGIVVPAADGERVVAELERYRFRVKANLRIDPRPGHSLWGMAPAAPAWEDGDSLRVVTATPGRWQVVFAAAPPRETVLTADQFAALRIAAAEPWFGIDVDEGTIPQETGLVDTAVSFTKGCYLGQELVARIDSRGHVNRHLRRVHGAGAIPPTGAAVERGGTVLGTLGTVAPTAGGWMALAVLRREAEPGVEVVIAGSAAGVVSEATPAASSQSSNPSEA